MQTQETEVDSVLVDTVSIEEIVPIKKELIPITQRIIVETKQVETKKIDDDNCTICDCNLLISLIWPITLILILFFFRNELKRLLTNISGRIRKIKIGGFELELEDLKRQTEQVEKKYFGRGVKYENYDTLDEMYFNKDVLATFLSICLEIEGTIREIFRNVTKNNYKDQRRYPVSAMIESLHQSDVIDLEFTFLLRKFWIFRNGVVHAEKYEISEKEFKSFVDIGIRILRILKVVQEKFRAR